MRRPRHSLKATTVALALIGLALGACSSMTFQPPPPEQPPPPQPAPPGSFPAQDLVGRWGLAAYHQEPDRERTVKAAANQCRNPYVITPGPTGGVMMHLADQSKATEVRTKGGPGGKTYVGPEGPAPEPEDREVVSFDGRVLILRWMDPEVQSRYGTMVYVRCGPEGQRRPPRRAPRTTPRPRAG